MKAVCWYGTQDVRVENVPDPQILNPKDAIVKVTLTAICGSDLHLYDGYIPSMQKGDILGHEFMGEVVEVGSEVKNLKKGDCVVVPFPIACGECYFCQHEQYALCDNSNPQPVSIPGVYGGIVDNMPMGVAFGKGLTMKMGQTHVHHYLRPLLEKIDGGEIDPSYIITHRMSLQDAANGYDLFHHKHDNCVKVVMQP